MKCLIVFMLVYFLSKTTFISSAEAPEILENDYGECRVKMYKKIESLRGNGYPNANAWPTTPVIIILLLFCFKSNSIFNFIYSLRFVGQNVI